MRTTHTLDTPDWLRTADDAATPKAAIVLAWSLDEPERVGEVVLPGPRPAVLGRGDGVGRDRLGFLRMRPGRNQPTGGFGSARISRAQLEIRRDGAEALEVRSVGRGGLGVDGTPVQGEGPVRVVPGQVLTLPRRAVLLVVRRPPVLPLTEALEVVRPRWPDFGAPDEDGILGESPAAWALRDRVAFAAARPAHVLVLGPSGAGKELAARAIHRRSPRAGGPWVARSAATLPEGLMDAELFGHARNYPNPGMPERPGLVGEADGGTLFLDEIGELPAALQAHLLRVLDEGEYQRLGESRRRRSDLRVLAATNRPVEALKADLGARFALRVAVPPLAERPGDVPLLARHLLQGMLADADLESRFTEPDGRIRVAPDLMGRLLAHPWPLNVRELEGVLWAAVQSSERGVVEATGAVEDRLAAGLRAAASGDGAARVGPGSSPSPTTGPGPDGNAPDRGSTRDPATVGADELARALEEADGVAEAARRLGLRSRYQVYRLMKRHGIDR